MAVAFDAASSGQSSFASSLTFSHTTSGSNRYLTVGCYMQSSSVTVSGVTYNSVALTFLGAITNTGSHRVELWGLANPSSGANNIVVTFSATTSVGAGGISFTGVKQSSSTSGLQTRQDDGVTSSSLTVTSATGDMVVDIVGTATNNPAVGAGQTQRYTTTPVVGYGDGSTMPGEAAAVMSWTFGATNSCQAAINIVQSVTFIPKKIII